MVEAFMLIQTEVGRAEVVAKQLAGLPGVLSSEYVTGPYDVVVRVGADTLDELQVQRGSQRAAGHRDHPDPDLPDRRRSATLEFGVMNSPTVDGPPRAVLIAAVVVAVGGRRRRARRRRGPAAPRGTGSGRDPAVPAPQADSAAVPRAAGRAARRSWATTGAPSVRSPPGGRGGLADRSRRRARSILRCGLERPADFVVGSPMQVVDDGPVVPAVTPHRRRPQHLVRGRPAGLRRADPAGGSGPTPIQAISTTMRRRCRPRRSTRRRRVTLASRD